MDKRAAELYLNKLFGTRAGHVAVAYKDKGQSWQECQFAWPAGKNKLIAWAEIHQDANIFVCPALRGDAHTRKKRDGKAMQWLWADVDRQSIPADKLADVDSRIAELGTYIVASGSGDNAHVYVKLTREVTPEEFIKLNTGLRDYLYGDNKQADNSLLRLPGTMNWKTDQGTEVAERGGNGKEVSPTALLKRRAFRDAKIPVEDEDIPWSLVDVSEIGLPSRILRMTAMPVDQALGKYGKRFKAVRGVVKELWKRGLDPDQIHTLMDKFPAGLEKMAEENGYHLHEDINRCLVAFKAIDDAAPDLSSDERDEVADQLDFEEATDADSEAEFLEDVRREAEKIRKRRAADRMAREIEAEHAWIGPPADVSWSLSDALVDPPRPIAHLIAGYDDRKGLAGARHNVVITAQYKTGKTIFVMGALARSLCDATPFLEKYPVNVPDEGMVVGHWNCEMDPQEMLDDYIRPVAIKNTDNLHVANLRGYRINILTDQGKRWAVEWLTTRSVKAWTIDSFARLARMAGVSEKDNDEVMTLLMALDEIKVAAGVETLFLITHTGRAEMEEGKERARGATAIDDWADARWIMTKMDKIRFLAVEGRSVGMDTTALHYEEDTKRYELGYGNKSEVKSHGATQGVVQVVADNPGIGQAALLKILAAEPFKMSRRVALPHIQEAVEGNFVVVERVPRPSGGRAEMQHWLVGASRGDDDGPVDRMKKATARPVDLRGVVVRPRSRI